MDQQFLRYTHTETAPLIERGHLAVASMSTILRTTQKYSLEDIYNMDEYLVQAQPTWRPRNFGEDVIKEYCYADYRLALCVNASGKQTDDLVIIRRGYQAPAGMSYKDSPKYDYKTPTSQTPYHLFPTKHGQMIAETFYQWLQGFDNRVKGKKVLLIVDQMEAHKTVVENLGSTYPPLENVNVLLLPKRPTAFLQPVDQGIIPYLRHQFYNLGERQKFLDPVYDSYRHGLSNGNLLSANWQIARNFLSSIWQHMDSIVIRESFLCVLDARVIVRYSKERFPYSPFYPQNKKPKNIPNIDMAPIKVPIWNASQLATLLEWDEHDSQLDLSNLVIFKSEKKIAELTTAGKYPSLRSFPGIRRFWTTPFNVYIRDKDLAELVAAAKPSAIAIDADEKPKFKELAAVADIDRAAVIDLCFDGDDDVVEEEEDNSTHRAPVNDLFEDDGQSEDDEPGLDIVDPATIVGFSENDDDDFQ